jgi:hypothetical protein
VGLRSESLPAVDQHSHAQVQADSAQHIATSVQLSNECLKATMRIESRDEASLVFGLSAHGRQLSVTLAKKKENMHKHKSKCSDQRLLTSFFSK